MLIKRVCLTAALIMLAALLTPAAAGETAALRVAMPAAIAPGQAEAWLSLLSAAPGAAFQPEYTADSAEALLRGPKPPDMLLGFSLTAAQLESLGFGQGLLRPLDSLISHHGAHIKAFLKDSPYALRGLRTPGGWLYALPLADMKYSRAYRARFWLNEAWLNALGLEKPGTTQALYDTLLAFGDRDPNGNGIADEVPLTANYDDGLHSNSDAFLMNAFTYYPLNLREDILKGPEAFGLYIKGGRVVSCLDDLPGMTAGLDYVRKLVEEGLFWRGSFAQNRAVDLMQGEGGLAGSGAGESIGFCLPGGEMYRQYAWLPPLTGPRGERNLPHFPYDALSGGDIAISSSCAQPEAAFRLLDLLYAPTPAEEIDIGIDKKSAEGLPAWLAEADRAYAPYADASKPLPPLRWTDAAAAEANALSLTLAPLVKKGVIGIMKGDAPLEGYEAWLEGIKAAGLSRLIALYQTAWEIEEPLYH